MEQNENYKFNKTIFWEEKFLTEEGGGSVRAVQAAVVNCACLEREQGEVHERQLPYAGARGNRQERAELVAHCVQAGQGICDKGAAKERRVL